MRKTLSTLILLYFLTSAYSQTDTIKVRKEVNQNFGNGKKLFRQHCSPCHSETDQKLTAPPLIGVKKRLDIKWLISWTKSSEELIISGDKYANEIYKKWGTAQPEYKFLTDEQIKDIYLFTDSFVPRPKKIK
jgi:mono/diheme cytochrome c family protein